MEKIRNLNERVYSDVPGTTEFSSDITAAMEEPDTATVPASSPRTPRTPRTDITRRSTTGTTSSTNVEKNSDSSPGPKTPNTKSPDLSDFPEKISKSRTIRFHKLFKTVPAEEYPFETFSCAFKGDILLQGSMYVSKNWICFYSKIKARGRLIEIPIERIISITKEKLALFIPNAIGIQTADQKYVFGSFISRDSTYKKLSNLWKFSQDNSSNNAAFLLAPSPASQSPSTEESDTTEDDLPASEVLERLLAAQGPVGVKRKVEVEVNRFADNQDRTQQCLSCRSVLKTFCSFSYKLQKVQRTNLLLAICTILVFFLFMSAVALTYKILLLQSRMEVGSAWLTRGSGSFRDRAMSNLFWMQTETHASVVRQLHSVLEANIHLLGEVEVLLKGLFRLPDDLKKTAEHRGERHVEP